MEQLRTGGISVQGASPLPEPVMNDRYSSNVAANKAADGTPVAMHWQRVAVVIGIHVIGEILLLLIGNAFYRLRLDFGAGQRGQQHPGENGNDGNNYEQFN